ncbi:MAG: LuxR C-terminal-related transcriptional regulator [Chloroflexota bacterium]
MSILATKLYIPTPNATIMSRQRLIQRLNNGLERKLTLISASAGFGKTTLVTDWIGTVDDRLVAWVSLNELDSDPTSFLHVLAASFQTVVPSFEEKVMILFEAPQPPSSGDILTILINELSALSNKIVLVLDDYHLVDSAEVDTAVTFFLDHLPPNVHLMMTTREDPQLPLSRYRGRGQLSEFRAHDLRFSAEEAVTFFNDCMGLSLTQEDVDALDARTEGWVAGLQMAALSLYGRSDTASFVQAFKGSHRFVLDYLVEEVLENQPEAVQVFLRKTAVLDRLCAPLCNAVIEQENSQQLLEILERHNLFLIPLDDNRHWYRYHHLFADVLKSYGQVKNDDEAPMLHQRASRWFEQHQLIPEAIEHALLANDFTAVGRLCELNWPKMYRDYQAGVWHRWVKQLPPKFLEQRPVLAISMALASLTQSTFHDVEQYIAIAERWLNDPTKGQPVVADPKQFEILSAMIATAQANLAVAKRDKPKIIEFAQKALALLPEDHHSGRLLPLAQLGLTYFSNGEIEKTYYYFSEVQACFFNDGDIYWGLGPSRLLSIIRILQGRLDEAQALYKQALVTASKLERKIFPGLAELYLGMGEIAYLKGDIDTAVSQIQKAKSLGQAATVPGNTFRHLKIMALVEAAQGHVSEAFSLLDEAERLFVPAFLVETRTIDGIRGRLWVKTGRLAEAKSWVTRRNFSTQDDVEFANEFDYLAFARVNIEILPAEQLPDTIQLLAHILKISQAGGRQLRSIETLILLAMAQQKVENQEQAQAALAQALYLAEPQQLIRPFLDEISQLTPLLKAFQMKEQPRNPEVNLSRIKPLIQQLLQKTDRNRSFSILDQTLIEPLSDRELEILQLVADGLSNREISEKLFVALNTVKGHNHRIFSKLQVNRRTEAVARARELGLI